MKTFSKTLFSLLMIFILSSCEFSGIGNSPKENTDSFVCGDLEVQCIRAPCPPIKTTFVSRAEAEKAGAKNITNGACIDEEINPEGACLSFDGNWLAEYLECEGMSQSMCEDLGGIYNACLPTLRHDPGKSGHTQPCVQVCQF